MVHKYDPDAFHHHSNPLVRYIERKRVRTIIRLLEVMAGDRVLEVGCGAGNVMGELRSVAVFGVDISETILLKARNKLDRRAHLFQGDAQNLPCKDGAFSHVICSEVLEHILNPSLALNEIKRVLREQGIAVISIPNELSINRIKNILIRLGIFHWFLNRSDDHYEVPEKMQDEWHLHSYPLEEWLRLFGNSFKATHLERIPFFWLPIRYVMRLTPTCVMRKKNHKEIYILAFCILAGSP